MVEDSSLCGQIERCGAIIELRKDVALLKSQRPPPPPPMYVVTVELRYGNPGMSPPDPRIFRSILKPPHRYRFAVAFHPLGATATAQTDGTWVIDLDAKHTLDPSLRQRVLVILSDAMLIGTDRDYSEAD